MTTAMSENELADYLQKQLPNNVRKEDCEILAKLWVDEFRQLEERSKEQEQESPPLSLSPIELEKNRFHDVLPSSDFRVRLSGDSDYINADRCPAERAGEAEMILTQAPLRNTVLDLVRLISEQQVRLVLCLAPSCSEEECYLNFVDFHGPTMHKIESALCDRLNFGKLEVEVYRAKVVTGKQSQELEIIHVTNWPDRSMPERIEDLVDLLLHVRMDYQTACHRKGSGPLLIHCQAGVGRTGVVAAGLRLLESCFAGKQLEPTSELLLRLRSYRRQLIPFVKQYIGLQALRSCIVNRFALQ